MYSRCSHYLLDLKHKRDQLNNELNSAREEATDDEVDKLIQKLEDLDDEMISCYELDQE